VELAQASSTVHYRIMVVQSVMLSRYDKDNKLKRGCRMGIQLPPPRHRNWLLWGVFGALAGSLVVSVVLRLALGQSFGTIGQFLQAWVALGLLFLVYFAVLSLFGFFGFSIMAKTMLAGFVLASLALFYFAWRDNSGWGGIAAVAGFLQVVVLAVVGGLVAEFGTRLWKRLK